MTASQSPQSDRVTERRRKLVTLLAELGLETDGFLAKIRPLLGTTIPAIQADLQCLKAGDLPKPEAEALELSTKQLNLADDMEKAKTDEDLDTVMTRMAAGVMRGDVTIPEAKQAHAILMGRRFFFAELRRMQAAKGQGGAISVVQAAPLAIPGVSE